MKVVSWIIVLLWKAVPLSFTSIHNCSQGKGFLPSICSYSSRTAWQVLLPALILNTVNIPQNTRVIHHNDERPDTLAFNSQFFQAVPLQFQIVIGQLLNEKPGSTWKATTTAVHPSLRLDPNPPDSSHSTGMPVHVVTMQGGRVNQLFRAVVLK